MHVIHLDSASEKDVIVKAVAVLRRGGMIVYPTETVYGLGVDATNQEAVNTLLKFKGQRGRKPILIAVSDQTMAEEYVELNDVARRLYRTFLPGPVAVVSRMKRKYLALGIASLENTVGIRIPNYPLVLKIITAFGKPITSTSANVSGARNPWSINDIVKTTPKNKLEFIDLILDAGQLPKRSPSTVVDTSRERTEIVREGEVALRALQNIDLRFKIYEEYTSRSEEKTREVAKKLIDSIIRESKFLNHKSALIFALHGPLGAGKTVFTKGIARALGITDPIRSPSYTLVREYSLSEKRKAKSGKLFHIDVWRLHDPSEFQDLGFDRMLQRGNVIVIEWIERLAPILSSLQKKAVVMLVEIEVINDRERNIKITR